MAGAAAVTCSRRLLVAAIVAGLLAPAAHAQRIKFAGENGVRIWPIHYKAHDGWTRKAYLVLSAAGCSFADVVKVTTFLVNVDDRPAINPVRMEFFGDARPASTLIEVSALAVPGALLEIEAVAAIPD